MKDFNAWHLEKFGMTFEKEYQREGDTFVTAFNALSRLMREYVSAAVAELSAPPALPVTMKAGELKPGVKWPI